MRDRLMLEYPEKMCEYCCNFDKEHIGMDGTALCKLTMTLAYAEDYGGNCMFYNVPKEQIIVPPCKVGDTVYYINLYNHIMLYGDRVYEAVVSRIVVTKRGVSHVIRIHGGHAVNEIPCVEFGKNVFLNREEAERALKGENNG